MKKLIVIFFLAIACFACNRVEKPEKVLSEDEMVNILYDLSLLQAINSHSPQVLDSGKVDVKNYIYKKYKTDSITFKKNHIYYASQINKYEKIQNKVLERIKKDKKPLDDAEKEKNKPKDLPPAKKGNIKAKP